MSLICTEPHDVPRSFKNTPPATKSQAIARITDRIVRTASQQTI